MKRIILFIALFFGMAMVLPQTGCKTSNTANPATLAPGYLNSADESMGVALVGAHAFYATIQQDVAAGKYTPSATEKTALNNFATALNAAQILYIAYHNGMATQAQTQAAVDAVTKQQAALQATVTGGK